jgi:hypothetical protein
VAKCLDNLGHRRQEAKNERSYLRVCGGTVGGLWATDKSADEMHDLANISDWPPLLGGQALNRR